MFLDLNTNPLFLKSENALRIIELECLLTRSYYSFFYSESLERNKLNGP